MTTLAAPPVVDRRYDIALLFEVRDGNPNGDPDAGNLPRLDPETNQGIVSDVCLKRKLRNAMAARKSDLSGNNLPGFEIYFQHQGVLNKQHERAFKARGLDHTKKSPDATVAARRWMCENFVDVRTFGAVMTTGVNCGQVRGPVQVTFARSLNPIVPAEHCITRKSVTTEEDAKKQMEKDGSITGTMGRKHTVPYALYLGFAFVTPSFASDTGFTFADLDLVLDSMANMFEIDRSSSRGLMSTRGIWAFQHGSPLGSAPAHVLFDRVRGGLRLRDPGRPARAFEDYDVPNAEALRAGLPRGIVLRELVGEGLSGTPWGA